MNIKPKQQSVHQPAEKKEWKKVVYSMNTHREDYEALCSFGKYLHKTWGYVCREDSQYADWCRRELLLGSLGVLKLKHAPIIEKPQRFVTEQGIQWISISVYDRATTPCPAEWLG